MSSLENGVIINRVHTLSKPFSSRSVSIFILFEFPLFVSFLPKVITFVQIYLKRIVYSAIRYLN